MKLTNPSYFSDGMRVCVRASSLSTDGVWCVVSTAMGDHARVANAARGIDRVVSKWDAWVEDTSVGYVFRYWHRTTLLEGSGEVCFECDAAALRYARDALAVERDRHEPRWKWSGKLPTHVTVEQACDYGPRRLVGRVPTKRRHASPRERINP